MSLSLDPFVIRTSHFSAGLSFSRRITRNTTHVSRICPHPIYLGSPSCPEGQTGPHRAALWHDEDRGEGIAQLVDFDNSTLLQI